MTVDDGEDVVEIVRHTAGKLADGLHFLRLAELFLQATTCMVTSRKRLRESKGCPCTSMNESVISRITWLPLCR